jgi:hypothetical protein
MLRCCYVVVVPVVRGPKYRVYKVRLLLCCCYVDVVPIVRGL